MVVLVDCVASVMACVPVKLVAPETVRLPPIVVLSSTFNVESKSTAPIPFNVLFKVVAPVTSKVESKVVASSTFNDPFTVVA